MQDQRRQFPAAVFEDVSPCTGCIRPSRLWKPGTREEIQEEVEIGLTRNGWEGRSKAIVIDPELEVWVWSRSPIVAEVLGWDTDIEALRRWLESEDLWASHSI